MHIGLIGAGLMGHGMAVNLLKHGHALSVIAHRNRGPIDDLVARGATEAKDLGAIAKADVILLCVTTSKVVAGDHRRTEAASAAGPDHPRFRHLGTRCHATPRP